MKISLTEFLSGLIYGHPFLALFLAAVVVAVGLGVAVWLRDMRQVCGRPLCLRKADEDGGCLNLQVGVPRPVITRAED